MAEKRAYRGSMTVFFSVLTVLFLALISAMAESVRVQGARAKAASVLDLGIFSVFGEYERDLLEEYEVFGVDASYGGEDFQKEKLSERLDFFMKYNIEPTRGTMLTGNTLFPVRTEGSSILRTLLLTDEDGWVFRDQIVQNLKSAAGTELAAEFLEARKKSQEMEKNQKDYEKRLLKPKRRRERKKKLPGETPEQMMGVLCQWIRMEALFPLCRKSRIIRWI